MKLIIIVIMLVNITFMGACDSFSQDAVSQETPNTVTFMGRVEHQSFGGGAFAQGFYGIVADDGTQYKPLNLSKSFQIEGLRVKVMGRLNPKKLLTSGWGTPLDIIDIQRLK
ncbi:hypothetical protein ACFL4E_03055 [Candidatus Omnitrophota bacterium]